MSRKPAEESTGERTRRWKERLLKAACIAGIAGLLVAGAWWWRSTQTEVVPMPGTGTAETESGRPPIPWMRGAPRGREETARAYRFAADRPDVLRVTACYCGCEGRGHANNEDCFVAERSAAGEVTRWENHGVACALCVDVAVSAADLTDQGANPAEAAAWIERRYGRTGFRTPTPDAGD